MKKTAGLYDRFDAFAGAHAWAWPLAFALAALLLTLPAALLLDTPNWDVLSRYAPMAEAFGRGDWAYAFHPRIPPFQPVLGGVFIRLFHLDAYTAVKFAGILCWSLTFFPLFPLFKRVFGKELAIAGCVFALFTSHTIQLVYTGLREPGKGLFMVLAVYCLVRIVQEKGGKSGAFALLGAACAGMICVRDDTVLFAVLFAAAAGLFELFRGRRFPWRTLVVTSFSALILLTPLLTLNYRITGYPVPSNRFVKFTRPLLKAYAFGGNPADRIQKQQIESANELPTQATPEAEAEALERMRKITPLAPPDPVSELNANFSDWLKLLWDVTGGLYLYFLIPAAVGIFLRLWRKKWSAEETVLLAVPLLHALLIAGQIAVFDKKLFFSSRYGLPLAPLFCGWTAVAFFALYHAAGKWTFSAPIRKKVFTFAGCILALALFADSLAPVIRDRTSSKRREQRKLLAQWSKLIRNDYRGPERCEGRYLDSDAYYTFRRPQVYSEKFSELGYFSGGESLAPRRRPDDLRHPSERIYEYLAWRAATGLPVDYIAEDLLPDAAEPVIPGYEKLAEQKCGGKRCVLWKKQALPQEGKKP